MDETLDHLSRIILELDLLVSESKLAPVADPLVALETAANQIGKAWCGSWLGYQSRVYYENLKPPPPGANFSSEWGLHGSFNFDTTGAWCEFDFDAVRKSIFLRAGNPDLSRVKSLEGRAMEAFDEKKADFHSLIALSMVSPDAHLEKLVNDIFALKIFRSDDFIAASVPNGRMITYDHLATSQGFITPPHFFVLGQVMGYKYAFRAVADLSKLLKMTHNHFGRKMSMEKSKGITSKKIFIGHGRSVVWRELKDFIQERLKLEGDEFNRVAVAGIATSSRLNQMLDDAAIAFLILTAEDELADGKVQARTNVVHEAGLFQGRLGFSRAIILLEEGCEEFSNIQGLGQLRFQKGRIKEIFEDIRQVCEREGIL